MSKASALMALQVASRDLRRLVLQNGKCLSEDDEWLILQARRDLEYVAREGGEIEAYIEAAEIVEKAA